MPDPNFIIMSDIILVTFESSLEAPSMIDPVAESFVFNSERPSMWILINRTVLMH